MTAINVILPFTADLVADWILSIGVDATTGVAFVGVLGTLVVVALFTGTAGVLVLVVLLGVFICGVGLSFFLIL